MPSVISFIFTFALVLRTKPHYWCVLAHLFSHVSMLLLIPQDYVLQYLIVMFFSAPILIRLSKRSEYFDVFFAFMPLRVGSGGLALA